MEILLKLLENVSSFKALELLCYWSGVQIGNLLGLPIGKQLIFGVIAFALIFYLFVIKSYSLEWLVRGRISEKKKRNVLFQMFAIAAILTVLFSALRLWQYRSSFDSSDIIVTDMVDLTADKSCYEVSKQFVHESQSKLSDLKIYNYDWPVEDLDSGYFGFQLSSSKKPIIAVAGICDSTKDQVEVQLKLKVLKNQKVPIDPKLTGDSIKLINSPNVKFEIKAKLKSYLASLFLAIEALAIECNLDCKDAAGRYVLAQKALLKDNSLKEISQFITLKAANIFFHLKDYAQAENVLNSQISANPDDFVSQRALGDLYALTNRLEMAEKIYAEMNIKFPDKKLEIVPNYLKAMVAQNHFNDADNLVNGVLERSSVEAIPREFWSIAGVSKMKVGKFDEGIKIFNTGLTLAGSGTAEYKNLQSNLVEALIDSERFEQALAMAATSVASLPTNGAMWEKKGIAETRLMKSNDAMMSFGAAKSNGFNSDRMEVYGARLASTQGEFVKAEDIFKSVEGKVFNDPFYYFSRAENYRFLDQCKKAIPLLEKLLLSDRQYYDTYLNLFLCYKKSGNTKKAQDLKKTAAKKLKGTPFVESLLNQMK